MQLAAPLLVLLALLLLLALLPVLLALLVALLPALLPALPLMLLALLPALLALLPALPLIQLAPEWLLTAPHVNSQCKWWCKWSILPVAPSVCTGRYQPLRPRNGNRPRPAARKGYS